MSFYAKIELQTILTFDLEECCYNDMLQRVMDTLRVPIRHGGLIKRSVAKSMTTIKAKFQHRFFKLFEVNSDFLYAINFIFAKLSLCAGIVILMSLM